MIIKTIKNYRYYLIGLIFLIAVAWILSVIRPDTNIGSNGQLGKRPSPSSINQGSSLELAMVGDMLPHETVTKAAKKDDGYDYLSLISPAVQRAFKKADLHFCNQESVSSGDISVQGYPTFNAPLEFPRDINKFGCDLISTANNHAADQGLSGIRGTRAAWDNLKPLAVSGMHRDKTEEQKLNIIEKNNIKVGFAAFNEVNNIAPPASEVGINMLSDTKLLDQQIKGLREKSDVVIVSVHWGSEDSHDLTSAQKKYARQIADLGADIIIGTGPHVWQPYQEIIRADGGKSYLWNSIGNGLNSQTKPDQLFSAIALMRISKDRAGKVEVSSPRVLPTYMHYLWGQGVGLSQPQLLARKDLRWSLLSGSGYLIAKRNDFKTTEPEQIDKLKQYLANDKVEILKSY